MKKIDFNNDIRVLHKIVTNGRQWIFLLDQNTAVECSPANPCDTVPTVDAVRYLGRWKGIGAGRGLLKADGGLHAVLVQWHERPWMAEEYDRPDTKEMGIGNEPTLKKKRGTKRGRPPAAATPEQKDREKRIAKAIDAATKEGSPRPCVDAARELGTSYTVHEVRTVAERIRKRKSRKAPPRK